MSFLLSIVQALLGKPNLNAQMTSTNLREKFSRKHSIAVGLHSYGCFDPNRIAKFTTVGRYCSFAPSAAVYNRNHPKGYIGMTPYFYEPRLGIAKRDSVEFVPCHIGDDVWLGHNSVILPGAANIGRGAIIGSGAIVTRDVPPYAVVAGNPARIIGYRFDQATIDHIEKSQWWTLSPKELSRLLETTPDFIFRPRVYFG